MIITFLTYLGMFLVISLPYGIYKLAQKIVDIKEDREIDKLLSDMLPLIMVEVMCEKIEREVIPKL